MTTLERRHGWPTQLPALFDWLTSGFPMAPETRTVQGLHGIRIEGEMTDGMYVISAELPGIDVDKDVEITIGGDVLTIRAERSEKTESKHHSEFRYGTFARSIRLPASARGDEATADYKEGILTIKIPVSETKAEAHTVKVHKS